MCFTKWFSNDIKWNEYGTNKFYVTANTTQLYWSCQQKHFPNLNTMCRNIYLSLKVFRNPFSVLLFPLHPLKVFMCMKLRRRCRDKKGKKSKEKLTMCQLKIHSFQSYSCLLTLIFNNIDTFFLVSHTSNSETVHSHPPIYTTQRRNTVRVHVQVRRLLHWTL